MCSGAGGDTQHGGEAEHQLGLSSWPGAAAAPGVCTAWHSSRIGAVRDEDAGKAPLKIQVTRQGKSAAPPSFPGGGVVPFQ